MSLATRCIACGTIFRVVQDQLRVSEGWVRCGRCDEVFNALEGLFDMEREAPPQWTARPVSPNAPSEPAVGVRFRGPSFDDNEPIAELDEENRINSRFFHEQESLDRTPAQAVAERDRKDFADAEFNMELLSELAPDTPPPPPPEPMPTFVRRAESEARWQRPVARALLSVVVLLLGLALASQVAVHFRDTVALRWPPLRAPLLAWCGFAGCEIAAPKHIDDIVVESSALSRSPGAEDHFRLAVTLRNRGAMPVAMPHLDLTLTDVNGQLVARRALTPAEYSHHATSIAATSDAPAQVVLATGNPRVSGYTVEVFYP